MSFLTERDVEDIVMKHLVEVKMPKVLREEAMTLKSLQLPNLCSRYFNACPHRSELDKFPWPPTCKNPFDDTELRKNGKRVVETNVIAPFSSIGKKTCGYLFNPETENRRTKIGIPPADPTLWKWFNKRVTSSSRN